MTNGLPRIMHYAVAIRTMTPADLLPGVIYHQTHPGEETSSKVTDALQLGAPGPSQTAFHVHSRTPTHGCCSVPYAPH